MTVASSRFFSMALNTIIVFMWTMTEGENSNALPIGPMMPCTNALPIAQLNVLTSCRTSVMEFASLLKCHAKENVIQVLNNFGHIDAVVPRLKENLFGLLDVTMGEISRGDKIPTKIGIGQENSA